MIIKKDGEVHFTKDFGTVGESDRIILPARDHCRVKVTRFQGNEGEIIRDIVYTTDETVYVIGGLIKLWQGEDDDTTAQFMDADSCYHVRAGEIYNMQIIEECLLLCIFSSTAGPLPDDE